VGISLRNLVTREDLALLDSVGLKTTEFLDHPTACFLSGDALEMKHCLPVFIVQDMPHVTPPPPSHSDPSTCTMFILDQ
jgi:hypothetical protein